jgi:uncharacterized protein
MAHDEQADVIRFLSDPASYGSGQAVDIMETHISVIALIGTRAYKLKKQVKLPYVDFSTAELRIAACRKEVELNGATAPGLYLGTRLLTRRPDGGLEFDGAGEPVDAVVEMLRFDQRDLFDTMAREGRLDPPLMTRLAHMIAQFHRKAPVVGDGGGAANMAAVLDINDAGFAQSDVFAEEAVAVLSKRFRARLDELTPLLDRRAADGSIRRCHGDLHLRNICLFDGKPRLFDCIEFNMDIATSDVLYDLAFLLMDLWHRDFPHLANLVMNRYLDETRDDGGLPALSFFMAVRAAVRAHVVATQAEEPGQDRARLADQAHTYFELADRLLNPSSPSLIAIGGFSGTGKSTLAEALAPNIGAAPGARVMESDRVRKALYGVPVETVLPDSAYTAEISSKVYREMTQRSHDTLAAGSSVVADAVFDDPEKRRLIESAVRGTPATFQGAWLEADPALLLNRVRGRQKGPSDATAEILAMQLEKDAGETCWRRLDAALPVQTLVTAFISSGTRRP